MKNQILKLLVAAALLSCSNNKDKSNPDDNSNKSTLIGHRKTGGGGGGGGTGGGGTGGGGTGGGGTSSDDNMGKDENENEKDTEPKGPNINKNNLNQNDLDNYDGRDRPPKSFNTNLRDVDWDVDQDINDIIIDEDDRGRGKSQNFFPIGSMREDDLDFEENPFIDKNQPKVLPTTKDIQNVINDDQEDNREEEKQDILRISDTKLKPSSVIFEEEEEEEEVEEEECMNLNNNEIDNKELNSKVNRQKLSSNEKQISILKNDIEADEKALQFDLSRFNEKYSTKATEDNIMQIIQEMKDNMLNTYMEKYTGSKDNKRNQLTEKFNSEVYNLGVHEKSIKVTLDDLKNNNETLSKLQMDVKKLRNELNVNKNKS